MPPSTCPVGAGPTAGLPANDKFNFCLNSGASGTCYRWNNTIDTYAKHKANCQNLGGYLVSYNTEAEQRSVETAFSGAANYWLGIEPLRNVTLYGGVWVLADGQFLGNLTPSTAGPYRHW